MQSDALIADWLDEAAEDVADWGIYASEYFREKHDLYGDIQKYKDRAAQVRAAESDTWPAPIQPTEAMLRPFVGCPPDELELAYEAMRIICLSAGEPS